MAYILVLPGSMLSWRHIFPYYLAPGGVGGIYSRITWLQVELEAYILVLPGSRWSWGHIFPYYMAPGGVVGIYSRITWLQVELGAYILVFAEEDDQMHAPRYACARKHGFCPPRFDVLGDVMPEPKSNLFKSPSRLKQSKKKHHNYFTVIGCLIK